MNTNVPLRFEKAYTGLAHGVGDHGHAEVFDLLFEVGAELKITVSLDGCVLEVADGFDPYDLQQDFEHLHEAAAQTCMQVDPFLPLGDARFSLRLPVSQVLDWLEEAVLEAGIDLSGQLDAARVSAAMERDA